MEGVNRLYVLGCIASVVAPIQAVAEWSSHWLTLPSFLRVLVYLLLSVPVIVVMWIATTAATIITAAIFKQSSSSVPVSLLVAFMPWAVGFITCYDHLYEFPAHYYEALLLTAAVYAIESVSYSRSRGQHVGERP